MEVIDKESATTSHNKKCGNCKNYYSITNIGKGTCNHWGHWTHDDLGEECGYWEIGEKWKVCSKCGEVKEREGGFYKDKHNKDGRCSQCKICQRLLKENPHLRKKKITVQDGYKYCNKCDSIKKYDEFYKNRSHSDGLNSSCKLCVNDQCKRYREDPKNKKRIKEYLKEYREKHKKHKPIIEEEESQHSRCFNCTFFYIMKHDSDHGICDAWLHWVCGSAGTNCEFWKSLDGHKKCVQCGRVKLLKYFNKKGNKKDGHNLRCKKCYSIYRKEDRIKYTRKVGNDLFICSNCKKVKKHDEFYRSKSKTYGISYYCKKCDREYRNGPFVRNKIKEYHRKYSREYSQREHIKERNRNNARILREDPQYRLNKNISESMRSSLKNGSKAGRSWEKLVGYTVEDLASHLESKFQEGMSWSNYGRGGWSVDHKIPKAVFNHTTPEHLDFMKCWSLDNLQPMWEDENLSKNAKLYEPFQTSFGF